MSEWIETNSGNRINRSAVITGTNRILLSGNTTIREKVELNGEVPLQTSVSGEETTVHIGKYCYVDRNTVISPPMVSSEKHGLMKIGSYTIIGENCEIRAANVGNRVLIESDVRLGNLSIIYDCCLIRQGTRIPDRMIIPPFSEVSGRGDSLIVRELCNSYKRLIENKARHMLIVG